MESSLSLSQNFTLTLSSRWKLSHLSSVVEEVESLLEKFKDISSPACSDISPQEEFISHVCCISDTIQSMLLSINQVSEKFQDDGFKTCLKSAEASIHTTLRNLESQSNLFDLNMSPELLKDRILAAAKSLLEECIKMFRTLEEAEKQNLLNHCDKVMSILNAIKKTCDKNELVSSLKELTRNLTVFLSLIAELNKDNISMITQYQIFLSAHFLKSTIQLFSDAVQVWVQHPGHVHASTHKEYVVKQMSLIIECMATAYEAERKQSPNEDFEPYGSFVNDINKILQLLTSENTMCNTDLVSLIKGVVCHSLAVAHLSVSFIQVRIHHNCQMVLQLAKVCEKVDDNAEACNLRGETHVSRQSLMEELRNLQKVVNYAVLMLIIEVATLSTEPLNNLISAALQIQKASSSDVHAVPLANFKLWVDAFHQHTDKLYQVAKFSASFSENPELACRIHLLSKILELLDPEVVPAVLAYSRDLQDVTALHHLHIIKSEWTYYLNYILDSLLRLIDVQAFLKILESQMQKGLDSLVDFLYDQEGNILIASEGLYLQSITVLQMATVVLDRCTPPSEQDLQLAHHQLEKTIKAVKSAHHHLANDLADLQSHRCILKRLKILMSLVTKICQMCKNACKHDQSVDYFLSISNNENPFNKKDLPSNVRELPLAVNGSTNIAINHSIDCGSDQDSHHTVKDNYGNNTKSNEPRNGVDIDLTAVLEELSSVDTQFAFKEKAWSKISSKEISVLIDNVSLNQPEMYGPERLKDFLQSISYRAYGDTTNLHHSTDKTSLSTRKELVSMTIKDSWNYSHTVEIPEKLSLLMSQLNEPPNMAKESKKSTHISSDV